MHLHFLKKMNIIEVYVTIATVVCVILSIFSVCFIKKVETRNILREVYECFLCGLLWPLFIPLFIFCLWRKLKKIK